MTFNVSALQHVHDAAGLNRLSALLTGKLICVDLETTQLSPFGRDARVVCAAVTFRQDDELQTWVVGLSHPDSGLHRQWRKAFTQLAEALRSCQLIAHNASFDLTWIKVHTGVNLYSRLIGDTALTSHLLDENRSAGLKARAVADLGAKPWLDFSWKDLERDEKLNPDGRKLAERETYYTMTEYCGEDTYWTYRLFEQHDKLLGITDNTELFIGSLQGDPESTLYNRLGEYYRIVGLRTVQALASVEENGFHLDRDWCLARLDENAQVAADAEVTLLAMTQDVQEQVLMGAIKETELFADALGYVLSEEMNWAPGSKWFQNWATVMCANGDLRVTERTPTGRPKWSKDVLDRQARQGSEAARLLRLMRVATTESAYVRSWLETAQEDGRIRASYNYHQVVTGRLSCSKPNLQQVARSAKRAFCARPGNVLVSADYSQVELRVAAFQARCEPMIEAYRNGADLHTAMAAVAANKLAEDVTPEERQRAKAANFGFLFGMGAQKFVMYAETSYGVEFEYDEAEAIRDTFFSTWDGMAEWHAVQRKTVTDQGYVVSPLGRVRRPAKAWADDRYERGEAERQAINSPVQGMASDIMMLAVYRLVQAGLTVVGVIHDCVVVDVEESRSEEAAALIKATMERDVLEDMERLGVVFDVPLIADLKTSYSWG